MHNTIFHSPFRDLAGSIFLTLSPELHRSQLTALIAENINQILDQPKNIKVIYDNYQEIDVMNSLETALPDVALSPYSTTFFYVTKTEINNLVSRYNDLNWASYRDDFDIDLYESEDKEIFINLLLNSFAVNFGKDESGKTVVTINESKQKYILDNFDINIANPDMQTYIIRSKVGEIVGSFSLTRIAGEVQLSAVAGRFVDSGSQIAYSGGKKLPLLSAAFVEVFEHNENYSDLETLSFSNSKPSVIKFYSDLGFDINTSRKGVMIEL
jgi:hypothetical protein